MERIVVGCVEFAIVANNGLIEKKGTGFEMTVVNNCIVAQTKSRA